MQGPLVPFSPGWNVCCVYSHSVSGVRWMHVLGILCRWSRGQRCSDMCDSTGGLLRCRCVSVDTVVTRVGMPLHVSGLAVLV